MVIADDSYDPQFWLSLPTVVKDTDFKANSDTRPLNHKAGTDISFAVLSAEKSITRQETWMLTGLAIDLAKPVIKDALKSMYIGSIECVKELYHKLPFARQ